jgi:chaperone BCS1
MSGLLNVLDGVSSQEGRIVIMTTNRPEQLNGALVRPGRVDMKVLLGNISQASSQEMFLRMFSPELGVAQQLDSEELLALAAQFAREIPEDTFTPSFLQGFFQLHLDCPREAAASIGPWVQKAIAHNVEREFEMVNRNMNG